MSLAVPDSNPGRLTSQSAGDRLLDLYRVGMRIEVLAFAGCPNRLPAVELAKRAVADAGLAAEVVVVDVETNEDAQTQHFLGSPTIRIDGRDVEPGSETRTDFARSCRIYRTAEGASGLPPIAFIRAAIAAAS